MQYIRQEDDHVKLALMIKVLLLFITVVEGLMWEQVRHLWWLRDVVPGCVDVDGSLERIRMSPIFLRIFYY